MERNTLTSIYHLQVGDRFYRANDPKKEVWEKVKPELKGSIMHWAKRDGNLFAASFRSNMEVIFLRHKETGA